MDRWLIVGLGNPEVEYGGTRHNIGADVVVALADRLGTSLSPHKKVQALVGDSRAPDGSAVSLVRPFGYMNTSGGPVQSAMAFYKVAHDRLIVVHDDLDLPPGALRLKRGGGDGGHNGLKDIRSRTSSGDYVRVRFGIGRPPGRQEPKSYVLKRFGSSERADIDVAVEEAGDAVLAVVADGLEAAQNRFNHRGPRP